MKILIMSFCPPRGAIADNFIQIANDLARHHEVSILCSDRLALDSNCFKKIFAIPYSKRNPFALVSLPIVQTIRGLLREKYDIVFCFDQHILNVVFSRFCRSKAKVMWWHEPVLADRHRFLNRLMYACHDYFQTRSSDKIIVACESVRKLVPARFLYKTVVVPLPFLEFFEIEPHHSQPLLPNVDFVFFGNIEKYKGLNVLANALRILYEQELYPVLHVLGGGNMPENAAEMVALSMQYPEQVQLLNSYQSYETIVQYVASSRAVVLPYLSATGTNTLPIAYRYTKPVIASRTGSLADYVMEGETGLLVEPGDAEELAAAIRSMYLLEREQVNALGQAAYSFYAENFVQSAVTRQLTAVFDRCLERQSRSASQFTA